jgi:nucleoside-diphosphate-sugar epimerase
MSRGPLCILLTGAASGLGRGLARYLAAKGHRLFLADRDAQGLRETVELLGAAAPAPCRMPWTSRPRGRCATCSRRSAIRRSMIQSLSSHEARNLTRQTIVIDGGGQRAEG